jgi:hypothetical protein
MGGFHRTADVNAEQGLIQRKFWIQTSFAKMLEAGKIAFSLIKFNYRNKAMLMEGPTVRINL